MKNLKEWILSIQHLFAMFGATVLVPLLVGINPSIAILTAIAKVLSHFSFGSSGTSFITSCSQEEATEEENSYFHYPSSRHRTSKG